MKRTPLFLIFILVSACQLAAQQPKLSEQIAATAMTALWHDAAKKEAGAPAKWTYEYGVVLKGIEGRLATAPAKVNISLHSKRHGQLRQRRWHHSHL